MSKYNTYVPKSIQNRGYRNIPQRFSGRTRYVNILAQNLNDLNDVDTSGVQEGYVLEYDQGSGTWIAVEKSGNGFLASSGQLTLTTANSTVTLTSQQAASEVLKINPTASNLTVNYPNTSVTGLRSYWYTNAKPGDSRVTSILNVSATHNITLTSAGDSTVAISGDATVPPLGKAVLFWTYTTTPTNRWQVEIVVTTATTNQFSGNAVDVVYDPSVSGLASFDVQAAIDELAASSGGGGDERLVPLVPIPDGDPTYNLAPEDFGNSWLLNETSGTYVLPATLPQWADDAPLGTQFTSQVFPLDGEAQLVSAPPDFTDEENPVFPTITIFPYGFAGVPVPVQAAANITWTKAEIPMLPGQVFWLGVINQSPTQEDQEDSGPIPPVQYRGVKTANVNVIGTSASAWLSVPESSPFDPYDLHVVGITPNTTGDTVDLLIELTNYMICPDIPDTTGIPMRYRITVALEDDAKLGTLAVKIFEGASITVPYTKYTSGPDHDGIELDVTVYSDNSDYGQNPPYRNTGIAFHTVRVVSVSRYFAPEV